MARHEEKLLDHEYDGIREYDNPTPGWWHLLFWGGIVFAVVYGLWIHGSIFGTSPEQRWFLAEQAYNEKLFGELGTLENDALTLRQMANDEKWMALGSSIFVSNCAQCHLADGGGLTGPNLTDDHYKNVKEMTDLYDIVTNGISALGMPAWDTRLGQNQRVLVAAYVATMRGNNIPGKAPEGDIAPEWDLSAPPSDDAAAE
ncbi:MAG: cbb3-type cytochrome c oxidase N-terminal domain-containing protein [Planctomycetota bacterium]